MKSVLYHDYEPNADLTYKSDDVTCFLDTIKYDVGNKILLVGNIGNLGNRLRMLGVYVTILENSHYEDVCYSLIHNSNCNVIKGCLELLPFEDEHFDKVIILDHFNNTNNCKKALREITRVLKEDGEVVLEDLNLKNLKVKLKNFKQKLLGENVNYYYPDEIISLFSKLNFDGNIKEFESKRYIYIGKRK
ncbi:class I SAM-dependent methyltransferase [Romboutsia sp.]|uniref:class I SAM-dependent methyltransferase n=1 Tax=Romboutsia sp. TaxID=1965302 RepID=UPI003F314F69